MGSTRRWPATQGRLLASLAVGVAVAVSLSLAALALNQRPASAAFPGENGAIAFRAGIDVYTIAPNGGEPTKIADFDDTTYMEDIAFSPNGGKIAGVRFRDSGRGWDSDIWVTNMDGSNRVQITHAKGYNAEPAWFPDGRHLAIVSDRDGKYGDIYVLTLNAARDRVIGVKRLTHSPYYEHDLAVSPSGNKIAFTKKHRGYRIFTIRTNSPDARAVELAGGVGRHGSDAWDPDWSPNGKKIVFGTYNFDDHNDRDEYGPIYSISSSGGNRTNLTPSWHEEWWGTVQGNPVFSPDGKQIAFTREGTIWRMNADGTDPVEVSGSNSYFYDTWDLYWQPLR